MRKYLFLLAISFFFTNRVIAQQIIDDGPIVDKTINTSLCSYNIDLNSLPADFYIIKVIKEGRIINQIKVIR